MPKDDNYLPFWKFIREPRTENLKTLEEKEEDAFWELQTHYQKIVANPNMKYYVATVITDEGFIIGRTFGICEHEYIKGNAQPPGCYESHFVNTFEQDVCNIYKSEEEAVKDSSIVIFKNWEEDRIVVKPISEDILR